MAEFDIAFSYASEQFSMVEKFKTKLEGMGLNVFMDTDHPEKFVFKYVPEVLKELYDNEQIAMIIFLSKDYVKKNFTKYEGHIALDRIILEKRTLIIKIDDINCPGIPSSLHFFDLKKDSIDYICKAIYTAIKGELDIKMVFEHINISFQNFKLFEQSLNSESCIIFKYLQNLESYIKIKISVNEDSIFIFYNSVHNDGDFPIAEIYKTDKHFILINNGISELDDLIHEFASKEELVKHILYNLNIFLENLHD